MYVIYTSWRVTKIVSRLKMSRIEQFLRFEVFPKIQQENSSYEVEWHIPLSNQSF